MKWHTAQSVVLTSFLTLGCFTTIAVAAVAPRHPKCEYRANPVGIDALNPRLGWELSSSENGERQTAYRILVASSEQILNADSGDVWDTKKVVSDQSIGLSYNGTPLASGRIYFWKVKAWGRDGSESGWSETSTWTMGLLSDAEWKARWIGLNKLVGGDDTSRSMRLSARYLRKQFQVRNEIQRATVSVCGLGLYELSINGRKVGNEVLAPAQTQFNKRVLYNTYDVTNSLREGGNAVGVILGNGRFFAMRKSDMANFGFPRLLLQLEIAYRDGSKDLLATDETWKVTGDGPITDNNEYDGEKYDARKEMLGWDTFGYDDEAWALATILPNPAAQVRAQMNEPIRITETLRPVSVKEIRPGVFIFDMGQNMVGWVGLRVRGETGRRVRMRFAESLSGDSLYMANLRGAKMTDEYICKGGGLEEWSPRFTYHGFRYVEVTGFPGRPDLSTIEGKVVHDDVTRTGDFLSSSENMNQIFRNAVWGIRGNYRSFPTDCPQRDERQGWLGDRAMGSKGESFVFDIAGLYGKWIRDICDAQRDDGSISDVCPAYWSLYSDNVTWDGTPIVLLEMLRTQYADLDIVRESYPAMKKWYDYMTRKYLRDGLMPRDTYGDWCVPPEEPEAIHSADPFRNTLGSYIGAAYFTFLTNTMRDFAQLLGKNDDARAFARQAESMKAAFNRTHFDRKSLAYSNSTPTANILALAFNLVDERKRVAENLIEGIETRFHGHVPTGLVGAQFLMRTLTDIGRADIAYRFATQTDYPSWGYMIRNDATTIWELWNGNTADPAMNSQNHVMLLGDLLTWFFENLAGIKSAGTGGGFKHIQMKPTLIAGLDSVQASHTSPYGPITSKWVLAGRRFNWAISLPVNVTATLSIPAGKPDDVLVNGRPIARSRDVRIAGMKGGRLVVEIPSGSYTISSTGFALAAPPTMVAAPRVENKTLSDSSPIDLRLMCPTEGATIRYTTDTTVPTEKSRVYGGTLEVTKSTTVRVKAFKSGYAASYETKVDVEIHGKRLPVHDIVYVTDFSAKYPPANGERALIDREEGSSTFTDKKWVGYEAGDMEVILDMGKPTEIHQVSMRFLCSSSSWIFSPEAIAVGVSDTKDGFREVANVNYGIPRESSGIQKRTIPLGNVTARYLNVKVKNHGKCPDWHTVPGGDAWIFVDEIFVE